MENAARSENFASLDAARKWIGKNPLLTDYVLDLMIERGVLEVRPDGTVGGRAIVLVDKRGGKRPNISTEWRDVWPPREALLAAMATPTKFRDLQKALKAGGHPANHWFTLHAIWALEKQGLVEHKGKLYAVVAEDVSAPELEDDFPSEAELEKQSRKDDEIMLAAVKRLTVDGAISIQALVDDEAVATTEVTDRYATEWVDWMKERGDIPSTLKVIA